MAEYFPYADAATALQHQLGVGVFQTMEGLSPMKGIGRGPRYLYGGVALSQYDSYAAQLYVGR